MEAGDAAGAFSRLWQVCGCENSKQRVETNNYSTQCTLLPSKREILLRYMRKPLDLLLRMQTNGSSLGGGGYGHPPTWCHVAPKKTWPI